MKTFTFTLVLDESAAFDEVSANERIAQQCDDALLCERYGITYLTFDRQAESFKSALLSARDNVEDAGYRIVRVEPEDLVSKAEIARRSGRSRESIDQLSLGERGDGFFPKPVFGLLDGPTLWSWTEVAEWLSNHEKTPEAKRRADEAFLIREMNDDLQEVLSEQR